MRWLAVPVALMMCLLVGCSGGAGNSMFPDRSVSVQSVAVTGARSTAFPLTPVQFRAVATLSDGSTVDVTSAATWSTDNSAVATISNDEATRGLARAVAPGTVNVVASGYGSVTASASLTVSTDFAVTDDTSLMRSVACGNGLYVACGGDQTLYRSTDGVNWTVTSTGMPGSIEWTSSLFANGQFLLVGQVDHFAGVGVSASSADGIHWMLHSITSGATAFRPTASCYAQGLYVVAGEGRLGGFSIYTSPDGVTWTGVAGTDNTLMQSVVAGTVNGAPMFIATGLNQAYFTSPDGVVWTARALPLNLSFGTDASPQDSTVNRLTVLAGGRVYAIGREGGVGRVMLTSNDALAWTSTPIPSVASPSTAPRASAIQSLTYGNGTFLVSTLGRDLFTSPDAVNFTRIPMTLPGAIVDVSYLDGRFFGVGQAGMVTTSAGGQTFVLGHRGTQSECWADVAAGAGRFVAVGYARPADPGPMEVSSDGRSWSPVSFPSDSYRNLQAVTHGLGTFVAVGIGANVLNEYTALIFTSPDGVTWTSRTSPVPATPGWQSLTAVACNQRDLFVIVGVGGSIQTSPDAVTWTRQTSPTTKTLNGVAYNGSSWVAVGASGTLLRSPDGISWATVPSGTAADLYGIGALGSLWLAAGDNGTLLRSTDDGLTWSPVALSTQENLVRVVPGEGLVMVLGERGTLLMSTDGSAWTSLPMPVSQRLAAGAYLDGRYVIMGGGGLNFSSGGATLVSP